jgi:hypothetical protein
MRTATNRAASFLLCLSCGGSAAGPAGSTPDVAVPDASLGSAADAPRADGGVADLAPADQPDAAERYGVHLMAGGVPDELTSIAAGAQLRGQEVRYSISASGKGPGRHSLQIDFTVARSLMTATIPCGEPGLLLRYDDPTGTLVADPTTPPCQANLTILPRDGNGRLEGTFELTVKSQDGARRVRLTGTIDCNVSNQAP